MAGDKFDQLYNALKADGAVTGTREHFKQFVYAPGKQGYHNRKQLYDALHADGAVSSKSYEEFAQRLGLHAVNPKPQQQKPLTMKQRAQEVAAQYQKSRQQKAQQPRTDTTSGTDYMQNWRLMHMRNDQMNPMQQAQASNARARMQRAREQAIQQEQKNPITQSRADINQMKAVNRRFRDMAANGAQAYSSRAEKKKMYDIANANSRSLYENSPVSKSFNEMLSDFDTPDARRARAKQQREDDARALAKYEVEGNKFVRNDGQSEGILGNDLLSLVDSSMNEAQELTRQQYQQNLDKMGGIYAPQSVKEQAFRDAQTQEQVNRQNVLMNNLSSKINEIYSQKGMQRHIAESAEKLNMSVEEYVDKYVTPEIMNYAQKALTMRNQEEIMPHGALDYIAKNLSNSIIGMVLAPSVMSRDTRQRLQEGIAIADGDADIQKVAGHKDETYRSGIGTRFASTAVNMAADSGPLAVIGAGASAAVNTGTRVLTNGLVKAGVTKAAQKLTAQQMAFKVANMTTAQKIMSGLGTRTATSSLNLAGYSGVTAALSQASTGDDTSLQAIAEAGLKGAGHGAVTGAMFGVSGAVMSPWVSKFGITGLEKSTGERLLHGTQKFGATAAGLGVEAGTMMVADNVTGDKDISFGTWLEDVVMVGAFKAGEPSNFVKMGNILHHLTHNSGGNFVIGKNANGSPIAVDIRLTPDEKNELISSASGKNLMDAFVKVDRASKTAPRDPKYKTAYTDFMNDPDVSQSTKEKVNAAMGLFNTTRGKSYRSVNDVKNKQILEYTKNGTLLTRTSYKNADERRAILYKQKLYRDNDDMLSLIGYSKMKDMQLTDEDGIVTKLAFDFLKERGYDENKYITDPKNAQLINDLRNPKSALYLDWEKYVDKNGSYGYLKSGTSQVVGGFMNSLKEIFNDKGQMIVDIDKIMQKDPMKRTDEENQIFYVVKRALEDELFPSGKPYEDQSASQGKAAAEDNNLGTEQPNGEVVLDELRNLRNAEQALEAAMDGNDVFKQTFERLQQQGLTPAQIYDALIQNGLTQEELTPLAQYINANARVQGMQQATADAIEENVKSFVSDWSYHGTLNGQAMNGDQALYVQDSNGRTLLVGSGDVAFDQTTGKAKEGSGDMLVCFDPNTREMVYVKADEVTLFQNQPIDQFAAEYRQRLQMKNSEPYNQAAQEQAMQDAAKAQQEQNAPQDNTTKAEDSTTKGGDLTKDVTTLTKVNTTSGKDNTTNEDLVPQEQPQQGGEGMRLEDGTPVPFDANGEPDFLKMTPEQGAEVYKMLFEEDAPMQIDSDIKTLEKDLEKVKASKYEGASVMERAAARKKVKEAIALAEAQVERAKAIKAAMEKKPEAENTGVGTVGNAGQYEKERQQGYREGEGGVIYRRQKPEEVGGVRGKEVNVAFSPTEKVAGHVKLVELDTVQASHNNGQLNLLHFGPDWQPKDRSSQASRVEAEKIAGNIDPEQITGSDNAFIGSAPIVNERHETIQGNNRVDALKAMYANHPDQAAKYKHWLIDHAAEFGLNAEDIKKMNKPVIVNELPVDDATAKKLGQMMASGFESGGKRIPEVSATINKLGDKMENLANVLLAEGTLGEDAKLSDLINQNSKRALEFLNRNGFIDNTEYENLATDIVTRRQWLENVLKASLFDGNRKTEAAFNTLPGNAQKAVLATFMRDRNSKAEDKIKQNIQKSFEAYNELNQIAGFKNAKNIEQARAAIQAELLNGSNNVFGEASIREKYTNFELELAALYKGLKDQKSLTGLFGEFYDAVQGKVGKELDAFSQVNAEPLSKDEAIEKVFGINNKQENDRRRETESPSESGGEDGAEPAGDRPAGEESEPAVKKNAEPSADPMEGIKQAADAFHEEQKQKGEFAMNLKIGKARQDYAAAKESGDAERTTKAAKELKHLLDDKLKQEGKGLAERQKIIAEEIGKDEAEIIDKPWEQMDLEEREAVSSKNPLTESEINELTSEENKELIPAALAYLRGDKGNIINAISYFKIWNDVRNRHENVSDNSGTENGTQLDAADTTGGEGLGLGRGRESGRPDGPVDRGAGNETAPGERNGGESNQNDTTLSAGEQGDKQGEGNSSGMGAVPAGSSDTNGGSSAGGNGHVSGGSGRESSNRPADTNAGRKPTAKQGTTFPDSTAERLKQERADYEKKKKDFWNRWKKAGQGYAKIALTPFKKLNLTPEQIEMLPELFKMHLNGAVLKIKEGIYKFNEWKAAMLAEEGEELKMIGLSDDDIDRFIEDYWNTPYEMDGETHTIREWSSIYGNQQLKKKLKEPLEEKYKRQMEAEPIEVKVGDMKNIEETLPYLLPQQQEDVLKAETQFFGKEHTDREHAYGKGYLFTNGTGTGKTYTGLGIAKRLAKQGKGRILFITPSQKKVSDWIKDGKNLGLDIKDLDSWAKMRGTTATTESGEGMVITTFANFGLNKKLLETEWDAVIYDECHRIMENKKGTETARSMQHYMVTNRDENHCFQRLQSINPEYQKMNGAAEKFNALRLKEIERIKKEYKNSHPSATDRDVDNATLKSLPRDLNSFASADGMTFPKLGKAYQDFIKARDTYNKVEPKLKEQAKSSWKHTKTIFLSATPFNTRENLDYVEGYIFKYPEKDERGMGGRTQFYLNHFGAAYKFRYHRLEQSISNPDAVAKQEVAFSDYLQNTLGTMSGRIIDSPYDYSRDFPTVAPDHADDFNHAVQDTLKTKYLHDAYSKTIGDYNYGSALFETMKVSAAIDRVKQHLDLGRKVVIFHRRVESKEPLEAPFAYMLRVANEQIKMMKPGKERDEYIKECTEFRNKYADLLEWEKTLDYSMPREQIAKVFGEKNVLFFSGKESKKVKDKAVDTFNDDDSGKNIIVIQEASGKEGISLHDTTSKHQRVCITLALPQSPITALQIEGRIYRIGNMSNAIFEYPILGLNSEMMLFGEKFNNQVSTTENLALGSQARNLRDSFANGILEHSGIVPVENQGVGGKEFDAATPSENDPFDNAVLDYYSNQKLNKNNREGSDYFPTPEPLGYKMVEWAGLGEGDSVLEPSAGHGAIARYVPKTNEMVGIEPSQSLFTKLQLKAGGLGRKFLNNTFENYALNNKHDVIVMNPPFGKAGALAIQHVDKAFKHLDEGGRIVAIIPRGSTDKKFDKWYNEQKNVAMRAEVNLPDILFQQAGTRVVCRVVVLDKISDAALRSKAGYPEKIDLSGHYDKIEDFFNDLRDIEMPERIIDTNLKMQKKAKAAVKDIMEIKGVKNVSYGKTGINVSLTGSWMNYGISFTGSDKPNYWRDKMANYYTKYDELQKLEYQENKQSVFDELKKLSCKLAGMTEDEMQRYIASKTNGSTHFREDRGLQYSKTDRKDVKNSRIIPEDVDKDVSSQIEKKFDDEIERVYGSNITPEERAEIEKATTIFSRTAYSDEWYKDENKVKHVRKGLSSWHNYYNDLAKQFEEAYGITRKTRITTSKTAENNTRDGLVGMPDLSTSRSGNEEAGIGRGDERRMPEEDAKYYRKIIESLAAINRAHDYFVERAEKLASKYGVRGDEWIPNEVIEKVFEDYNSDKNIKKLYELVKEQIKNLDVKFADVSGGENGTVGYYDHGWNSIRINFEELCAHGSTNQDLASTILHEMLHPLTSDIIAMYQKGHADKLTPSQIDAAKEAIDIYNELKQMQKDGKLSNHYGLTNPREMITELATPKWRKALSEIPNGKHWWNRIINTVAKFFGVNKFNKLGELTDTLDKLLSNFGKEQFDFASRHQKELFDEENQGKKVTDPEEIKRLEEEPKIKVYRAMQVIDGKLYPPMAASVGGKLVEANELGQWIRADENPDLAIPDIDPKTGKQKVDKKTGELKWKFKLDKGSRDATGKKATDINAAYNPYWHMSRSPLNDQFKSAWIRPNIVVVECETPVSELTSGYKAERAKDAVGEVDWKSGSVSGEVFKQTGRARKVILSRWCKPVRVLDDAEVAQKAKEFIGDAKVEIPENVLTPKQRIAFEEAGFKIGAPEKGVKKSEQIMEALEKGLTIDNTVFSEDGTKFRTDHGDGNYPASSVESHVEKVAQKTGGKVKMVSSVDEITNKAARAAIEDGRKITGWYDEKTGEVHLYMPNIHDRYTAEKTIWHEVVGHKGMRELFGDERFEKFLRDVWYDLDKPENAALKKLVDEERKYNPLNIYDAIEEGIARLAEDGKGEPGFWNGIKNKVSDFLHEIGYRIAPNTKDVKYLLWLSKNLQKNQNDPYWKMRAEAVKFRLDHDRMPAVVVRNGMYFDNDGKNHDYLLDLNRKDFEQATDGQVHFRTSPMTASKIEEYDKVLGTKLYAFKESTLNHLQALEEAMKIESGEKDVWKDIPSAFNPLQAANRMDSVCQQISAKYDSDITEPLAASFKRMVSVMDGKNKDEQKRNAELYMITKHGLERNRVLYVRDAIRDLQKDETTRVDAERLQRDWNATFKDLGDKLDDGAIRFDQFVEKMDDWIRHNIDSDYDSEAHDYSGLTAIKRERGNNDPDYSCVDDVMNTEDKMGKKLVEEFWKNKAAATDFIIDQEYYNGIKDSAMRNHLKSMFKFYIPLRKFDETTAEDIYGYITEKGDPNNYIGSVIANAEGRESLSDVNVLAQISAMAKTSILNGGKNVVKQHLLRFVQTYANGNNGNRIFLEINPWIEKHTIDGNEVWEEVTPQIPENATQEQISNIVQNFESSMQVKKENGEAKLYNRRGSLGVRFQRAKDKNQHIVEVYVAGKKRLLFCQGNPRAAQAVNGLIKDSGASKTWAAKNSAKINRFCAQANTSYNIDFMFSNMTRDLTVASANVTKEGPKYTKDFCTEYLNNLTSFRKGKEGNYWSMFSRYRKNKLDMNNDRERMFKEFMDNGGQTGFTEIKKLEDMMKEYDNLIKKGNMKGDNKVLAAMKNGLNYIEVANELFENIARYSCYVTSRKAGRSVGRSIYDAKEVSGNFNKHGSGDAIKNLKTANDNKGDVVFRNALGWFNSYMKNYTMFYNAGVQGASLFARNFKRNAAGMSMVFGVIPFALGIAQALINQYRISNEDEKERGGVKDPYAELPEWKRRNNICIYWGKGNFKTIPIGIELRAFFGLGDIAMGQSIYPGLKSDTPVGYDILGQMAQLVPASDFLGHHSPSGGTAETLTDLGLAAAPTALKPELELIANRDWTGRPIYRGSDYLDYAPRWKRAYDSTSDVFIGINKWANMTFNDFPDPTEDMKGNDAADFITAPYIYQHLLEGYFGGAGSTVSRIAKTGYKAVTGNFDEIDPNQIPLYRVFNYKPSEGHDMQRTKSKWYNYSDELKQTEYNIRQLKTDTPDVLKNMENNAKKFNFIHGEEGKAYNIWNAADSYIQKKKRLLSKTSNPEVIKSINEDINRKMQEAVNDLDKLN